MTLSTDVFLLELLAALCHACWNAVVKIGADRLVVLGVVNLVGAMLSLCIVPFVVFPQPAAWPWLFASFVLHQAYYYFLIQQYRVGDLSHVYPLSRGLSPLLVASGAALLAGEFLSLRGILGIGLAWLRSACCRWRSSAAHRGRAIQSRCGTRCVPRS